MIYHAINCDSKFSSFDSPNKIIYNNIGISKNKKKTHYVIIIIGNKTVDIMFINH